MYVNTSITLPEVFERVAKDETVLDKAETLRRYKGKALRWFVDALYNRDLSMLTVPQFSYAKEPKGMTYMTILTAIPRIESAIKLAKRKPKAAERNLVIVLESVSVDEANLLIKAIRGERKIDGISKAVFKRVYPDLFQEVSV